MSSTTKSNVHAVISAETTASSSKNSNSGVTLSTSKPTTSGVSTDEGDLALGLGVGLPLCVLVMGLLAASVYIILKRRNQTHSCDADVEENNELQHSASKRRKQHDHYIHAIQHHDQATPDENPDPPLYSNVSEAVYVNVTQAQAPNTKQEQQSSHTPRCPNDTLNARSEQQCAESAEPVYENLKRTP